MSRRVARREWRRGVAAVLALVVLPSVAPDFFMVACPHHVGHESESGHVAESGHASEHSHHDDTGHGSPVETPPCTCAGECPVSQPPRIAGSTARATFGAPVVVVHTAQADERDERPRRTRFLQPPATAPPEA